MISSHFRLKIWRIEQMCVFELSWGTGQQLTAKLSFPETLTSRYQVWRTAYQYFYNSALRGRVEGSGSLSAPPTDWRSQLVQAEASLLSEFYYWLSSAELLEIRAEIARAAMGQVGSREQRVGNDLTNQVDVFLMCDSLELAKFPWEAWEIGTEFAATKPIRIARTPANIRAAIVPRIRRGRLRVLAILGDDTGLSDDTGRNFQAEQEALRQLAEVKFVGWQQGKRGDLKAEITQAIADEQGWDILFFAGHSNETVLTGGELAIAPNQSILLREIAPELALAKERGLQFALFNSCSGLSLAHALIDLGLSQVAVMREPIHNRVAQEFLVRFVQQLAEYRDVHDALLLVCQSLKLKSNLTYPSAHLIPSLFRHPDSRLFQLEPSSFGQRVKRFFQKHRSAIAVSALLLLSLLPLVQNTLLEQRLWMQAAYRTLTNQLPATKPPVLLVQVDEASLTHSNARRIYPIDPRYLAMLLDQIRTLKFPVVGIDYLLDKPTSEDPVLARSLQQMVKQKTWLVFGSAEDAEGIHTVRDTLANPDWSLRGYTNAFPWYVELLPAHTSCTDSCPFAYLLTLVQDLSHSSMSPQPRLESQVDLLTQVVGSLNQSGQPQDAAALHQMRLSPLTSLSQNWGQQWLQPILDFSIPPDQVYQRVTAQQLLSSAFSAELAEQNPQPIVLLAPGGYDKAGINGQGEDNFVAPKAIAYWHERLHPTATLTRGFTGAEAHAYMIHHLLNRRLVVPVPDLWVIGLATILGQGTALLLRKRDRSNHWKVISLGCATLVYGLVSLQTYFSGAILLPWCLPSVAFWVCVLPTLRRKPHASN